MFEILVLFREIFFRFLDFLVINLGFSTNALIVTLSVMLYCLAMGLWLSLLKFVFKYSNKELVFVVIVSLLSILFGKLFNYYF
jgi:hypothetical protein